MLPRMTAQGDEPGQTRLPARRSSAGRNGIGLKAFGFRHYWLRPILRTQDKITTGRSWRRSGDLRGGSWISGKLTQKGTVTVHEAARMRVPA